jgi:hypothetical protein
LVPGSNPARYQKCTGLVEVSADGRKMYGQTYADATLMTYGYDQDDQCPMFKEDDFYITFYCSYE